MNESKAPPQQSQKRGTIFFGTSCIISYQFCFLSFEVVGFYELSSEYFLIKGQIRVVTIVDYSREYTVLNVV